MNVEKQTFQCIITMNVAFECCTETNNLGDCTVHERKKHVQSVLHTYTCRLHLGLLNHVQTLIK